MATHPKRSKHRIRGLGDAPTFAEVRAAREAAGLTQTEAARVIFATLRAWQGYEADPAVTPEAARAMHPALFVLFKLVTGQLTLAQLLAELERRAKP